MMVVKCIMDVISTIPSNVRKLFVLVTFAAILNILKFLLTSPRNSKSPSSEKSKMSNKVEDHYHVPSVEEIQKYIEKMPGNFTEEEIDSLRLEDLTDELLAWSKDYEWRKLVASIVKDKQK